MGEHGGCCGGEVILHRSFFLKSLYGVAMNQESTFTSATRDGQIFEEELIFHKSKPGRTGFSLPEDDRSLPINLESSYLRTEEDLQLPEVSEVDVIRHYTRLSTWNYGIDLNFYPLGCCTMKYNPRINEEIAALPGIASLHPDIPDPHCQGMLELLYETSHLLSLVTDMDGCSLQPSAGAHGELTGLFMIHAAHRARGEKRDVVLIPDSAHGTNPASCTLAGFEVRQLKSTESGLLDPEEVKKNLTPDVAALMITNPNTLGIFEENITEISRLLHENGSYIYMDGANYNAIMGVVSLKRMGVDICHLNLHKSFSTPHGGGGPGAAAVVASGELVNFLPGPIVEKGKDGVFSRTMPSQSIGRMKSGPGHTGIVIRALSYLLTMGNQIHLVAENAVLNAVYLRSLLEKELQIASPRDSMHEAVFNDSTLKKDGYTTLDLAKKLIDHGYHPPTVYFPLIVSGAMMMEPTETESPETIRHYADTIKNILKKMAEKDASIKEAPTRAFIRRVDEVQAARRPILNYFTNSAASTTGSA